VPDTRKEDLGKAIERFRKVIEAAKEAAEEEKEEK